MLNPVKIIFTPGAFSLQYACTKVREFYHEIQELNIPIFVFLERLYS